MTHPAPRADQTELVERLWRNFEAREWTAAREILHPDFEAEWPNSGEVIRGPDRFIEVNRQYPDATDGRTAEGWLNIHLGRLFSCGNVVVSEVAVSHTQGTFWVVSLYEFSEGRIWRAREYWGEANTDAPHPDRSGLTEARNFLVG